MLSAGQALADDPRDPIEGFNRAVFAFNEGLDTVLIRPVAKGYETVLPGPVRTGVSNFYGNINDLFISVNSLLQGKPGDAVGDAARFVFNSTFGIVGILDVASEMGIEKHDEDFGQTFGRWGAGPGAYLVLPIYGPRNVRDAAGLALDFAVDPVGGVDHVPTRNTLSAVRLVNERANLLPADKIIEEAALDKYSYIRDAYLQRRQSLVYDGRPPREPEDE
ncbi:MAG: VacJ family lipoprotein [Rhodocyclales bacterium]|nr:VacJ family lipoprotein [Rhodocyclales bacterium]